MICTISMMYIANDTPPKYRILIGFWRPIMIKFLGVKNSSVQFNDITKYAGTVKTTNSVFLEDLQIYST